MLWKAFFFLSMPNRCAGWQEEKKLMRLAGNWIGDFLFLRLMLFSTNSEFLQDGEDKKKVKHASDEMLKVGLRSSLISRQNWWRLITHESEETKEEGTSRKCDSISGAYVIKKAVVRKCNKVIPVESVKDNLIDKKSERRQWIRNVSWCKCHECQWRERVREI